MIKTNFHEIKLIFNKYHFLGILVIIFFAPLIGSVIIGIIPTVLIFLFLIFEKYLIKNENLKKYNFGELILNAIFYGTIIGLVILGIYYLSL